MAQQRAVPQSHRQPDQSTAINHQFTQNAAVFRDTMERIFEKYSNLDDPGLDVCLETMTFRTKKGVIPFNSAEAERELKNLRNRVTYEQSVREMEASKAESSHTKQDLSGTLSSQMDDTQTTKEDLDCSSQMESSDFSLGQNATSHTSPNSAGSSCTSLWEKTTAEDDEELERSLSSHGSTLLDVYPSMLNRINESFRRQHVTEAASAVLRRYRQKHWNAAKAPHHNRSLSNGHNQSLNKRKERSTTTPKAAHVQPNKTFSQPRFPAIPPPTECSRPKKNRSVSPVSAGCFYSPKREDLERSPHDRATQVERQPARVIDLSTSPSSSSPSPDLNRTYLLEPRAAPRSHLPSGGRSPNWTMQRSPLKRPEVSSFVGPEERLRLFSPSFKHPSFRSDGFDDRRYSPGRSQNHSLNGHRPDMRSPLKPQTPRLQQEPPRSSPVSFLKTSGPVSRGIPETHRSPFLPSPHHRSRHVPPDHKENVTMTLSQKRRLSLLNQRSQKSSRHLDSEFTKLYHHFVCRSGCSSSSSSCHLCQLERSVHSPSASSFGMSALGLTPLRIKRRRQPDVEETLRFKRFRESFSPLSKRRQWSGGSERPALSPTPESSEDQHSWNRRLLLHCPSPAFLHAGGALRKRPGYGQEQRVRQHSWKAPVSCVPSGEVGSPVRMSHQPGTSFTPRSSRRQLVYGPLQ